MIVYSGMIYETADVLRTSRVLLSSSRIPHIGEAGQLTFGRASIPLLHLPYHQSTPKPRPSGASLDPETQNYQEKRKLIQVSPFILFAFY